jgi:hypothetical protein
MPELKPRPVIQHRVSQLVAVISFVFVFALMTTRSATADEIEPGQPAAEFVHTTAAADGAGWLVFKGHRSERSENLAPSAVGLSQVAEPNTPHISALDRLSHSSEIQTAQTAR